MSHPRFEVVRRLYRYACGYCGVTETDSGGEIKHRQVSEAIVEHLEATLPISGDTPSAVELQQPNAIALAREEAAYIKLHPTLKLTHLGRYVAIYQGKLIDVDDEFGALVERVRSQLPNQVVWMTQVQEEPL